MHAKAEVLKSGPKGQTRTKVEVAALIGDYQDVQSCSLKRQKSGL